MANICSCKTRAIAGAVDSSICFHHNDSDGRLAAAIVKYNVPNCECIEVDYSLDETKFCDKYRGTRYDSVYVVDYSFSKEVFDVIKVMTNNLCWNDHHQSAKDKLPVMWNDPNIKGIRDIKHSGCMLTWKWFNNVSKPSPWIVKLVDDYDMWRFKYNDTKYLGCAIRELKHIETFVDLLSNENNIEDLIEQGKIIYESREPYIRKAVESGTEMTYYDHNATFVNSNNDINEIGDYITSMGNIAVIWSIKNDKMIVSLRSKTVDVGKIAEMNGGGGHKSSAGYVVHNQENCFYELNAKNYKPIIGIRKKIR